MSFQPKLIEVSLEISRIECRLFVWKVPRTSLIAGLARFAGCYAHGSAGSNDGRLIRWRIEEFRDCPFDVGPSRISGLLVDFSELRYEWGDDLDVPWVPELGHGPLRIIVSPSNREAMAGVLDESVFRDHVDTAIGEINASLNG